MLRIDIDTKMIALLGTPLRQSFAARMQNRAYEVAGLNYCYFYAEVNEEHLEDVVRGFRHMNIAGFAVTKPNKIAVLPYLDELDELCKRMGSCNTVVKTEDGRLIGYNTDGLGFYTSVTEELGVDVSQTECFLVGSGGAGRAIASVLAHHHVKQLFIMDKDEGACRALVDDLSANFAPVNVSFVPFGDFSKLSEAQLVINASGVGMGASCGKSPIPKAMLQSEHICFDACYNPAKTQFLLDAEACGCRTLNGLGMSLYQGAAQIELWSGKPAPVEEMRAELVRILREKGAEV